MPKRVSKWACEFCGSEHFTEYGAQQCEMKCQEKMSHLARTVNRHVRCSNPQCARNTSPYFRSEWRPTSLADRPWIGCVCPTCGNPLEEYIGRDSKARTPVLDKAMSDTEALNSAMRQQAELESGNVEVLTEEMAARKPLARGSAMPQISFDFEDSEFEVME